MEVCNCPVLQVATEEIQPEISAQPAISTQPAGGCCYKRLILFMALGLFVLLFLAAARGEK